MENNDSNNNNNNSDEKSLLLKFATMNWAFNDSYALLVEGLAKVFTIYEWIGGSYQSPRWL